MANQHVYIDTDILRFYFDKKDDKRRTSRSTITNLENALDNNHEIRVKIPQVVLGELMLAICDGKCDAENIMGLLTKLNVDIHNDLPCPDSDVFSCARELL